MTDNEDLELLEFEFEQDGDDIIITTMLYAAQPPSADMVENWRDALSEALDRSVHLSLISIPISSIGSVEE
jgi:hypothetical protein